MKHHKLSKTESEVIGHRPTSVAGTDKNEINFTPSPDEVARKAYFAYENEGSRPGHEVQHWLAAEAQIIEERKLTRTHGFHNKT